MSIRQHTSAYVSIRQHTFESDLRPSQDTFRILSPRQAPRVCVALEGKKRRDFNVNTALSRILNREALYLQSEPQWRDLNQSLNGALLGAYFEALFRLYSGSIQALFRLYSGSTEALLRLYL